VVDVQKSWGTGNPLVQAVAARHEQDVPAAQLAGALAPCFVLSEDGDLTANGFGKRDWLPLLHAFAAHAEMEVVVSGIYVPGVFTNVLIREMMRAVMRLPRWAQVILLLTLGVGLYCWQRGGRAQRQLGTAKEIAAGVWDVIGPPLAELLGRYNHAAITRDEHEIQPDGEASLHEAIARVLALGPDGGMLAREIVNRVDGEGAIKDQIAEMRKALRACTAFNEVIRGRWRLGARTTDAERDLTPEELAEWLQRAHRSTLPPRDRYSISRPVTPREGHGPNLPRPPAP
jgi:hypothetical protein